jgi:hypothetical protein
MLIALFSSLPALSCDKVIFKNLHSRYKRHFSKKDNQLIEDRALQALLKISKVSSIIDFGSFLKNSAISDLFSCEIEIQQETDELKYNILGVRYLVLSYLYDQMFQRYIASTETLLNSLLDSQKYWMYENFYMKQSWMKRNILYNLYSSKYNPLINKKLINLSNVEEKVAYMLGICLHGISRIEKIRSEDQMVDSMLEFVQLFYQAYNAPMIDIENQKNPIRLYQDLLWINNNLEQHMQEAKQLLDENSKPSYFVEHSAVTSCVIATIIAVAIMYKKYKQDIPGWCQRIQSIGSSVYHDYFIDSLYKIKRIAWDGTSTEFPELDWKPLRDISSIANRLPIKEAGGYKNLGIDVQTAVVGIPLSGAIRGNKEVHEYVNQKEELIHQGIVTADEVINNGLNPIIHNINAMPKFAKEIKEQIKPMIESTELTLYIGIIGLGLFGSYMMYSGFKKGYNYYINHENWYAPMRYIIRSIDQLLNKITRSDDSSDFAQDGKIYMLIQHLKEYISCLKDEELFLMNNDINELLSFDLNYHQKRGIVQRMYKTYAFLK